MGQHQTDKKKTERYAQENNKQNNRALILTTRWRYISHLLTCWLFTYLLIL